MNAFVRPRTDARHDEQVDATGVVRRVSLDELQRAMHAAGLVAMHATGDEHAWEVVAPIAAAQREQWIGIRRVVETTVLDDVEAPAQAVDRAKHVGGVAALAGLPRKPRRTFGIAPGLAGRADGIGC